MFKTNEQLVVEIMNFSNYGALSQVMVMQALHHFTDLVIEQKELMIQEYDTNEKNGRIALINIRSWIGVAEEIKQKLLENSDDYKKPITVMDVIPKSQSEQDALQFCKEASKAHSLKIKYHRNDDLCVVSAPGIESFVKGRFTVREDFYDYLFELYNNKAIKHG